MTHDLLCPHTEFIPCCESYLEHEYPQPAKQHYVACQCDLIAKVRTDERSRKGTCWREATEGSKIPAGAIRVHREAGWFWEIP